MAFQVQLLLLCISLLYGRLLILELWFGFFGVFLEKCITFSNYVYVATLTTGGRQRVVPLITRRLPYQFSHFAFKPAFPRRPNWSIVSALETKCSYLQAERVAESFICYVDIHF